MNVTMFLGIFYALMWLYWSIREQGLKGFFMHLFGPKGRLPGFMGFVLVFIFIFVGLVDVLEHHDPPHCAGSPSLRQYLRRGDDY